jgi:hypothetical protein
MMDDASKAYLMAYAMSDEHVQIRGCAPLERWRIPMWAANLLRGGTLHIHSNLLDGKL